VKLAEVIKAAKLFKIEHARRFAQHVIPEVLRPARIIWNQAIGGVFLLLAVYFLIYAGTHSRNPAGFAGGLFLGCVMIFFCVTSFLKARRISRP